MPIQATRAMLRAALEGELDGVETRVDPVFGLAVPVAVPGVEPKLLDPRSTWADPAAYDSKAGELARLFADNFTRRFPDAAPAVRDAGPNPGA
jgi:phosphoenolpyruvate carboxykinase (ATP)